MMSDMQCLVLVIDDDPAVCKLLKPLFQSQNYSFVAVSTGAQGIKAMKGQPDLVVLELDLPDMDGLEVIAEIRKQFIVPIIVLTTRQEELAAVFDAGVDDYVLKPFNPEEFLARVRAAIRRSLPGQKAVVHFRDLAIDLVSSHITVKGKNIKLTSVEGLILKALAKKQGQVLTYLELLEVARGENKKGDTHYIRQYIGQLRRKIEDDQTCPQYIINEPGVGYWLANGDGIAAPTKGKRSS
jgi:two-component system KDP operon response regulator KdpE